MEYVGIIEVIFGAVAFAIFYVWQMRSLNRDVKARKAREAERDAAGDKAPHARG
ncbi:MULTISPECIES: hypothetical protein [unclassified Roseitalea]|uniref:hypothetical protein n=1 Tax=unclassified Roseitalea TaxID=2639107 RepID=UPI00273D5758|nr:MULTISPECIES: hypothetical protein [unclassified Roseitalea]